MLRKKIVARKRAFCGETVLGFPNGANITVPEGIWKCNEDIFGYQNIWGIVIWWEEGGRDAK